MTLIDQRILIPAPMQAVWDTLANHSLLPKWRMDVRAVSVLTTEHNRPGTRRRISTKTGRADIIEEIKIWYEGIGYEYTLIEGGDYRSYVSRLRLQATADGTIVQWTISYDFGGLLKRFLGGRRRRKRLETLAINSLRQLRRYVESTGVKLDSQYRERNSIQSAPDASSRAEYGAKLIAQEEAKQDSRQMSAIHIPEPPVKIDDTPSVQHVVPPSFLAEALQTSEQDLAGLTPAAPPVSADDTRPSESIDVSALSTSPARQSLTDDSGIAPVKITEEPPAKTDDTPPNPAIAAPKEAVAAMVTDTPAPAPTSKPASPTENEDEDFPPPTAMRDTGEISIWEAFGVQRPSDSLSIIIDELRQDDEANKDKTNKQDVETTNPAIVPPTTETESNEPAEEPVAAEKKSPAPKKSLDEWLAEDEPPIPESSTGTMKTVVKIERKPKIGLRRLQNQRQQKIRRPKKKK